MGHLSEGINIHLYLKKTAITAKKATVEID
jgi:hypothetical protein